MRLTERKKYMCYSSEYRDGVLLLDSFSDITYQTEQKMKLAFGKLTAL